ncbi:MAG: hypothetical protein AAGA18_16245 [Verrucomicrobiota bacterium]
MKRELTVQEKWWVEEALNQEPELNELEKSAYKLQLKDLKVIEECDCGDPLCGSVKFSNYVQGHSVAIADGVIQKDSSEEFLVILFIDKRSDRLSELEIVK